jgi:hypothetical protein
LRANEWEWDGTERDENRDKLDESIFENLVKTPFVNSKREWVILFVMVMNYISCSLSVIPVPTF